MPELLRDTIPIHYETLGDQGPWVILTPGGHNPLGDVLDLGHALANLGCRVLLHDRRNCGASGLWFDESTSEPEIWVDDVVALLDHLGIDRVIAGGGSAGCRLSLQLAICHPERVTALLLWWVTGGQFAAQTLGHQYYGQYIGIARTGGMEAVAASPFYAERIAARPQNRDVLLALAPSTFISVMEAWQQYFLAGADLPVIGATESELRSITQPACIVPGSDDVHPRQVAVQLSEMMRDASLLYPFERDELPRIRTLPLEEILTTFRERLTQIFTQFVVERGLTTGGDTLTTPDAPTEQR